MKRKCFELIFLGVAAILLLFSGSCARDPMNVEAVRMPLSEQRSTLPQGNNGIAARYPGDEGIEQDPAVVFHDDFESDNLSKWTPGWRSENARITQENVHTGNRAMQWAVETVSGDDGGNMGVTLAPGLDVCFFRVYCRLPEKFHVRRMHGWSITATAPGVSPLGGAGGRPTGENKFSLTVDPNKFLSLYTYFPDMAGRWGTSYQTNFSMKRGKWHSIELMLKANEPGKRDGEIAIWADGKLIGHWAGFRYRDIDELKINMAHLVFYLHGGTPAGLYTLFHDDVVVATSYIGPMFPKK